MIAKLVSRRMILSVGLAGVVLALFASAGLAETVVRFDTALGTFDVLMFDDTAPGTVTNFLNYANDGDYANSFFHRLVDDFILQGGGFAFYPDAGGNDMFWDLPVDAPITNEYVVSNIRSTIAMAKLGGDPDSATSQFFFNLADNSANLDNQNGGFTVFGRVLGDGMNVVDDLASRTRWDFSKSIHSSFTNLPLIDYSSTETLVRDHLEMVNAVTVLPAPLSAGDFDGDGGVNAGDVDFIFSQIAAGTHFPDLDLDGDGAVGREDVVELVNNLLDTKFGDVTLDGKVNDDDLSVLSENWLSAAGMGWADGDVTGDGVVNGADLSLLAQNWQFDNSAGGSPTGSSPLPEPATMLLLAAGGLALLSRRTPSSKS